MTTMTDDARRASDSGAARARHLRHAERLGHRLGADPGEHGLRRARHHQPRAGRRAGKLDLTVTLDELLEHVASHDCGRRSADQRRLRAMLRRRPGRRGRDGGRARRARGAAGCSIEDYDPGHRPLRSDRRGHRAGGGRRRGGASARRRADRPRGEPCLRPRRPRRHAPPARRLPSGRRARRVRAAAAPRPTTCDACVEATDAPVNVLAVRGTPPVEELARLGVRRVSTGGALARAAYGALVAAADELRTAGTSTYLDAAITGDDLDRALRRRAATALESAERPDHLGPGLIERHLAGIVDVRLPRAGTLVAALVVDPVVERVVGRRQPVVRAAMDRDRRPARPAARRRPARPAPPRPAAAGSTAGALTGMPISTSTWSGPNWW